MNILGKLASVAALALLPMTASAAPIDLAAEGYELAGTSVSNSSVSASIFTDGSFSAFSLFTTSGVFSPDATDPAQYFLTFSNDLPGALVSLGSINALGGSAFGFELPAIGSLSGLGSIEVLFENVGASGVFAAFDGEAVLMRVSDLGLSAPTPSGGFGLGTIEVQLLSDITPVPLPAGGLLLLTGAGALVLTRRRKAA